MTRLRPVMAAAAWRPRGVPLLVAATCVVGACATAVPGGAASAASAASPGSAADSVALRAVRALLADIERAVERQDGEAMLRVYVQEPPISFASHGLLVRSRDAIAATYRGWRRTPASAPSLDWTQLELHSLGPDAVLAVGRLRLAGGAFSLSPRDTVTASWSGVFERRARRWGLAHEHESFTLPRTAP